MHLPLGTNLTHLKTLENSYKSLVGNRCLAEMYEWDYWGWKKVLLSLPASEAEKNILQFFQLMMSKHSANISAQINS